MLNRDKLQNDLDRSEVSVLAPDWSTAFGVLGFGVQYAVEGQPLKPTSRTERRTQDSAGEGPYSSISETHLKAAEVGNMGLAILS